MTLTRQRLLIGALTAAALAALIGAPGTTSAPHAKRQVPSVELISTAAAADSSFKDITFDDVKLELEKDEKFIAEKHLNEKVEKLEGQKIRIRGWIHPSVFTQTGITQFVLVRDNQECCFGPGAALHDCIVVEMEEGKSTNFTTRPIAVEGVFKLQEIPGGPKGRQLAIYSMKAVNAK